MAGEMHCFDATSGEIVCVEVGEIVERVELVVVEAIHLSVEFALYCLEIWICNNDDSMLQVQKDAWTTKEKKGENPHEKLSTNTNCCGRCGQEGHN
ncbi:hypothetical protein H5410_007999 [Solanum commersonii]|uniref:Uncharacterized protein n=1 Tax=Solanum commersonii TaxID=4109 RepID=A0A9J6ADP3_SOLCO|nr:hypothetical protein H5410_007999 [Solanum commersonii]